MPETILFYLFSAIAIGASLFVIAQRNPIHSIMLLVAAFIALAGLYLLLDAPFVAMAQMIIYAGAIMVLFLYVVMLLNAPQEDAASWDRLHPFKQAGLGRVGALLAIILVAQLAFAVARVLSLDEAVGSRGGTEIVSSVREMGRVLFTDYMFAFEATSILVLVGMVGAYVLARPEQDS